LPISILLSPHANETSGLSIGIQPGGLLCQCGEHLGEVAAHLWTELRADGVSGAAGDLHPVGDAAQFLVDRLDSVDGPDQDVAEVRLVDEPVGSETSAMRSSPVSWPRGVMEILLPGSNGPQISIRSMSAFHSPQVATSDHRRQMDSGEAVVSTLYSAAHIARA
jgi:hypothetical protein